jgi:hypothetical protein
MNCYICGIPAVGNCRFCGRAVCKEHSQNKPFILTVYVPRDGVPRAIAVGGALFCGRCKPQPSPIAMPELE